MPLGRVNLIPPMRFGQTFACLVQSGWQNFGHSPLCSAQLDGHGIVHVCFRPDVRFLGAVRGARVPVPLLAASVRVFAAVLVASVRDLPVDVDDALVEIDVLPPQAERLALP